VSVPSGTTDLSSVGGLQFEITGGVDQKLFSINKNTGAISFLAVPDYEDPRGTAGGNHYQVIVTITDINATGNQVKSVSQSLSVNIQDLSCVITAIGDDTSNNADFITKAVTQTIKGTFKGILDSDYKLQINVNDTWVDAIIYSSPVGGGTFSLSGVQLVEGRHTYGVRILGANGIDELGIGMEITLDTQIANASIALAPKNSLGLPNDKYINLAEEEVVVTIAGTTNNPLVEGDIIQLMEGTSPLSGVSHTVTALEATEKVVSIYVPKSSFSAGDNTYQLRAKITDAAGNEATS
jgi:hypothetical protein